MAKTALDGRPDTPPDGHHDGSPGVSYENPDTPAPTPSVTSDEASISTLVSEDASNPPETNGVAVARGRSETRQHVAEKWADRRRNQPPPKPTAQPKKQAPPPKQPKQPKQPKPPKQLSHPSLCFLLIKSWNDIRALASGDAGKRLSASTTPPHKVPATTNRSGSSFPSVISKLQANAVKQHINRIQHDDDDEDDDDDEEEDGGNKDDVAKKVSNGTEEDYTKTIEQAFQGRPPHTTALLDATSASSTNPTAAMPSNKSLTVLPVQYDLAQAIRNMCQTRSRAFLVVDLSAIVKKHVYWRKQFPSVAPSKAPPSTVRQDQAQNKQQGVQTKQQPVQTQQVQAKPQRATASNGERFQFVYSVSHNSNPQVLNVLKRLNVAFTVSTKYELECCAPVCFPPTKKKHSSNGSSLPLLYDNATCVGKPNSYYRRLVFETANQQRNITLAVDGPVEVERIVSSLSSMAKRRSRNVPSIGFLVRLPNTTESFDHKQCKALVRQTHYAALRCTNTLEDKASSTLPKQDPHQVVGISLDLPLPATSEDNQGDAKDRLWKSFFESVEMLIDYMIDELDCPTPVRLDLTMSRSSLPNSTCASSCKNTVPSGPEEGSDDRWCHDLLPPSFRQWVVRLTKDSSREVHVTLDMSYVLLHRAGALCTRIIGVKLQQQRQDQESDSKVEDSTRVHYYIDDGCYGSLYNSSAEQRVPLALRVVSHATSPIKDDPTVHANHAELQEQQQTATVWGPTCDGLDKVCDNVVLPPTLSRDDWLVFMNLGLFAAGNNIGTGFNGFALPDTAYCVVGYLHPPTTSDNSAETVTTN